MLYQLGIRLIIIVAAAIISRGFRSNNNGLIYEDEMDQDELRDLDEEIDD